jgi:hypothetical protein
MKIRNGLALFLFAALLSPSRGLAICYDVQWDDCYGDITDLGYTTSCTPKYTCRCQNECVGTNKYCIKVADSFCCNNTPPLCPPAPNFYPPPASSDCSNCAGCACPGGQFCVNNTCTSCIPDKGSGCPGVPCCNAGSGTTCSGGICVPPCKGPGVACSVNSDCCSSNCSNGICCGSGPPPQVYCNGACLTPLGNGVKGCSFDCQCISNCCNNDGSQGNNGTCVDCGGGGVGVSSATYGGNAGGIKLFINGSNTPVDSVYWNGSNGNMIAPGPWTGNPPVTNLSSGTVHPNQCGP